MPRAKGAKPNAEGIKRVGGWLICNVCHFTIPYAGYDDSIPDNRPKHRCTKPRGIQDFSKFTTKEPRADRRVFQ